MESLLKTALITGASRGIGKAIALELSSRGFMIYFTYRSKEAEARNTVEEIEKLGGTAKSFCVNSDNSEQIAEFFKTEIQGKVFLSVLVNNAGITDDGLLLRMTDDKFDQVVTTNLRGPFLFLREAAKVMIRQRYGRIINISSLSGQTGNAGQINYSSAKAGLIGMTKAAAKELGSRNITVNAVAPGFIETDMTGKLSKEQMDKYLSNIPAGRYGKPQDIANAVAFLASEDSSYITGQILGVNGGLYC